MIESSIEELFNSINNSNEYKEYKLIVNTLESNKEVIDLIEEIKKLQKEAVNLEYKNDDRYLEVDKLIKEKENILNNNKDYQEYLSKQTKLIASQQKEYEDFNNTLLASSSLIEDYVTDKVSI